MTMQKPVPHARDGFPVTRHSVLERIRHGDEDGRRHAFGDLIDGYWKPVYKHLRITWRVDGDEAADLTQAFFTDAFQKAWLERFDPAKGRFRTFVRVCADRFVMNVRQSASRLKRGGAVRTVAIDFDAAEQELRTHHAAVQADPDLYFHQEFVRALFERAVGKVRAEYETSGRDVHFALFERYDLAPAGDVSYAGLAHEFDLTATQVTNYLAQVRRRFRECALEALRTLCGSDAEFRREARDLFGVEAR